MSAKSFETVTHAEASAPSRTEGTHSEAKFRIAIVNMPMCSEVETNFLKNAIRGLRPACKEMYVIAGNFEGSYDDAVHLIKIPKRSTRPGRTSLPQRIVDNIVSQAHIMIKLVRVCSKSDVVFYDVGEYRNLFSILLAKLLHKTTVVFHHGGNKLLEGLLEYRGGAHRIIPYLQECMLRLCYLTVDYILCLSPSIVQFGGLLPYRHKILFCKHFVETDQFVAKAPPSAKENLIGYFGRLTLKKGIMNFIESLPLILDGSRDLHFVIVGKGELEGALRSRIEARGFGYKVRILPWIPGDEYAKCLCQLKFFILPSYEEGLPATMLEGMACGVIPIVTPVGGIPDIVTDGETGFIIPDNRPSAIAACVVRALKSPNLDSISSNAAELVRREYSLPSVVRRWQEILDSVNGRRP